MNCRKLLLKFCLISGVLIVGNLLASNPLHAENLDQLVQEALTSNPDLAASKARWEQSSHKVAQVGSLMDPVLSFAFSNYPSDDLSMDVTPMTGNEVKLAQAFPFPGKLDGRSAMANEQANWFAAVYRDQHYQLARKVKDAWYRLYLNQRAVVVVERNLALIDDLIRLTEVRYETGSGLQQDVLKAQVQRSKQMERLMTLRQQKTAVESELNKLLNRPVDNTFDVPEELELMEVDSSLDAILASAKKNRPMASAYQSLIERYRQQKNLARLNNYPDMSVWASWRFRDDDLPDGGTDFVSAGISVTLPVYREKRRAEAAEALAGLRMAERQAEAFRKDVEDKISNAFSRMEESREQVQLYREGIIPQTSQSLQSAMSAYQVGKVPFMSLLDALKTTYQAEMEYYRVSVEFMRSLAWLEAESTMSLVGQPLQLPDVTSTSLTDQGFNY